MGIEGSKRVNVKVDSIEKSWNEDEIKSGVTIVLEKGFIVGNYYVRPEELPERPRMNGMATMKFMGDFLNKMLFKRKEKDALADTVSKMIQQADEYELKIKNGTSVKDIGEWIQNEYNGTATVEIKINGGAVDVKVDHNGQKD